jgi:formylglycine-generating enzyme required for sulfatase activity
MWPIGPGERASFIEARATLGLAGHVQAQGDLLVQDTVGARSVETKTRVFVSYSRKDMAFADKLEAALRARGFDVLIDRQEIYAFEDWWKRIQALIGAADTVVFVLSPDAVKSDVALKEVTHAASLNKRFAPIVCRRVEDSAVPEALRRLNFIFFDDPERFGESAGRLAEALRTDIGWVRQHTEYGEAERRWSSAGRPRGLLLHSPTLEVAEYWIKSRPTGVPEPTKEMRDFVAASRQGARSAQRLKRIAQFSIFTLLIGVIVGLIGWINQAYILKQWQWHTTIRPFLATNVWPYVLTPEAEKKLKSKDRFRECAPVPHKDYCPEMVVLPAGSFMMGSPTNEPEHNLDEEPRHRVTIDKPFAVSKYEVTFDEWDICAAYGDCDITISDSSFGRGQRPVIEVTWDEAKTYVAWLSRVTGKHYRLLSEAEYEYATRAGSQTIYPWGNELGSNNANCKGCGSEWDDKRTAPVGSFAPNAFGLYDMVGNVAEWVEDCLHENYSEAPTDGSAWLGSSNCTIHDVRGGSWFFVPETVRSAHRGWTPAVHRAFDLGFRIATVINP